MSEDVKATVVRHFDPQLLHQTTAMRAHIALLAACSLLCSVSAFEWKKCAEGKADVDHVSLTPDPPHAGDTISFSIDAKSSERCHQFEALRLIFK